MPCDVKEQVLENKFRVLETKNLFQKTCSGSVKKLTIERHKHYKERRARLCDPQHIYIYIYMYLRLRVPRRCVARLLWVQLHLVPLRFCLCLHVEACSVGMPSVASFDGKKETYIPPTSPLLF